MTIAASKTFYAQYTANSYTLTWELGDGNTETTKQTYGEKLVLPAEPTRKGAEFLGWFTEPDGGTQVTANDVFTETADKTYYAHWELLGFQINDAQTSKTGNAETFALSARGKSQRMPDCPLSMMLSCRQSHSRSRSRMC